RRLVHVAVAAPADVAALGAGHRVGQPLVALLGEPLRVRHPVGVAVAAEAAGAVAVAGLRVDRLAVAVAARIALLAERVQQAVAARRRAAVAVAADRAARAVVADLAGGLVDVLVPAAPARAVAVAGRRVAAV